MQLTMLGGANEIGASSYLIEIEGKNILIDCGIRVGITPYSEALPAINLIDKLDLVLVTHAHMDHTGALPILYQRFRRTKIICTKPTFWLMTLLFSDTLKIMDYIMFVEGENPLYDGRILERMSRNIFLCKFNHWFRPFPDREIEVCFKRAGHILGAASILIKSKEGNMMFSGDFCIANQRTVKGQDEIDFQPDIMFMEATYGDKAHTSRKQEEKKLARNVERIISNKGKVLIPAFAIGRSQELILALRAFQDAQLIPDCPIYVDGMVRKACHIYQKMAGLHIFSGQVREVASEEQREKIAEGKPCCIVASSGMLIGGASVFYAQRLTRNKNSALFISGYQDEESPGRKILKLKPGDKITLDEKEFRVECQLTKYDFSAHADAPQLHQVVHKLNPKLLVLVHGEYETIRRLRTSLEEFYQGSIWVPQNKEVYEPIMMRR